MVSIRTYYLEIEPEMSSQNRTEPFTKLSIKFTKRKHSEDYNRRLKAIKLEVGTIGASRTFVSIRNLDYPKGEHKAHLKYKRMRMSDVIKEMEEEILTEEIKMILDPKFDGLGTRALELLKDAPMNR
jgi:hypothetical protein